MEHLEHNHILYELQYGFCGNRSCESQLISLINNDPTKSYDAGQQSDVGILLKYLTPLIFNTIAKIDTTIKFTVMDYYYSYGY